MQTNSTGCIDLGLGLVTLLSANAAVRALAWDATANDDAGALRMSPSVLPQGSALPAIVYHEISSDEDQGIDGRMGICNTRIQIDCYAELASDAQALRSAIERTVMPGGRAYRGSAGDEQITCITIAGRRSDTQSPADGSDKYQYIRQVDLLVTHRVGV